MGQEVKSRWNDFVIWAGRGLILMVLYFGKRDLEKIQFNQEKMIEFMPEYRERVKAIELQLSGLQVTTQEHDRQISEIRTQLYFIRPDDIVVKRKNDKH